MTRRARTATGRLHDPVPVPTLPFADTVEVADARSDPDEPAPCLPSVTSVWYALHADRPGTLLVDLAGSTPLDPVLRLYRRSRFADVPTFVGCASPVWNAQLSLEVPVREGETLLAQIGTSESREGRLVLRAELRSDAG